MGGRRAGAGATGAAADRHIDDRVLARLVDELGPEHVAEVCELFVADARDRVLAVRAACEAEDADGAARSAHRLKSASGFVGADRVSALCREIEILATAGRLHEVPARADMVSDELEEASDELADLLGRLPRPR